MKNDLIARYVYAVTRHLPGKLRADVEKELESVISDMLEVRGEAPHAEQDVRAVLTELGRPEEMAAKYGGEERRALISGVYYLMYRRVLNLVLPIVAGVVAVVGLVAVTRGLVEPPAEVFRQLFQVFGGVLEGLMGSFVTVTLIFALMEHYKAPLGGGDFLADLPTVPEKTERIQPGECVVGIVLSVVFAGVFLGAPQLLLLNFAGSGVLYLVEPDVARSLWLPVVLWAAATVALEAFKLAEGRYTRRLAAALTVGGALKLGLALAVFLSPGFISPTFTQFIAARFPDWSETTRLFVSNLHLLFLGVLTFALVLECVTAWVKARKYDRRAAG
jgi:hypothetical protein